jgi:hypothetical protein
MALGTTAFDACYAALPEARATARYGRADIAQCILAGYTRTVDPSEQGLGLTVDANLRFVATAMPTGLTNGKTIEVLPYGETAYRTFRVLGMTTVAGVVRLMLGDKAQ